MDRKQWITAILLSVAVYALWSLYMWREAKNHPPEPEKQKQAATAPAPAAPTTKGAAPSATQASATGPSTGPTTSGAATQTAPTTEVKAAPPHMDVEKATTSDAPVTIGSAAAKDAKYVMQLKLSPNGAAVLGVTLNQFPSPDENTKAKDKPLYTFETPLKDDPKLAALTTQTLVIDKNDTIDLWDKTWTKEEPAKPDSATFSIIVKRDGHEVAKVTKTYTLSTRDATKDTSLGYEVAVTQTIKNLHTDKITVHTVMNGTTPPPTEVEGGGDHVVVVGYAEDSKISITPHATTDFKTDAAQKELTKDGSKVFRWVGQASTYFAAIIRPADAETNKHLSVHADAQDPAAEVERNISLTIVSDDVTLAGGAETAIPLTVYFGPKWRDVVTNTYYSSSGLMYNLLLTQKQMWLCSFCTWGWLIDSLVWLLSKFHYVARDWGIAIICLVLLVRTLLHPITKRSQVKMMQMGKLAPEVEKLKKKYADQPDVLNREMMQLYKQQGGAILGCLPMFLQMPIWIALWAALQGTFELRQAEPFYGYSWMRDLAKPDGLVHFQTPINLYFFNLRAINILPLLMAVVTYINMKYFTPMPPAATPEQEQQQKIQRGMSIFFPLMFYTLPSGLNLYYLTSTTLGIVEGKIIRNHIKEQEELEKLRGPEIVSTKPTRGSKRGDKPDAPPAKAGLMARLLEAMRKAQEQAEQMKKDKDKGK